MSVLPCLWLLVWWGRHEAAAENWLKCVKQQQESWFTSEQILKVRSVQCSSRVRHMKAQAYLQNIHSLYIENKTTNKNNHLFYSSKKKKLKVKCIFLFFFFFQITRHIIYSTLCILAFPLSIHLDLISVKIKVYRHFSPLELTQHSLWGRGTHAHQVWPGQTTYSWLTAAGWETNSVITSPQSLSDQDSGANMAATGKVQRPNSHVWLCPEIQTDTEELSSGVKTPEQ